MAELNISQFESKGESVSLKKIDGQKFSIVKVEKSNYEENGKVSDGVRIYTKESFDIDGVQKNQFHTTRTAIVNKLKNPELLAVLEKGDTFKPVICKEVEAKKGGKPYFDLVEV